MNGTERDIEQDLRECLHAHGGRARIVDLAGAAREAAVARRRRNAVVTGSSAVAVAAAAVVALGVPALSSPSSSTSAAAAPTSYRFPSTAAAPGAGTALPHASITGADLTVMQLDAMAQKLTTCPAGQISNLVVAAGEPVTSLISVESDPRVDWSSANRPLGFGLKGFAVNGRSAPKFSQWWFGYSRTGEMVFDAYVDGTLLANTSAGDPAPAQHISAISCIDRRP